MAVESRPFSRQMLCRMKRRRYWPRSCSTSASTGSPSCCPTRKAWRLLLMCCQSETLSGHVCCSPWRQLPTSSAKKSFAGSHTRRMTNFGQEPKLPTLASQHVLAESKSILDCHMQLQRATRSFALSAGSHGPATNASSAASHAPQPKKALSSWHEYFRAKMKPGLSMRQLAQSWRHQKERSAATLPVPRALPVDSVDLASSSPGPTKAHGDPPRPAQPEPPLAPLWR